ncbi:MAG: hydrogenase maturation nickel metallochaperone HypA [Nitrosomonadales bacterium]|nr:hydrogenase maturation nickel metallochaperone HypA [Nitrosomonadales bacterium]
MHEMSLAEGVLQIIEDSAKAQNFRRVKTVWLEIGQLAGVEVEAMRFCFDAVMRDSVAQGAKLEIVATPGQAWCMDCAATVQVQALYDICPQCGGARLQVTGGNEMRVKELEVE